MVKHHLTGFRTWRWWWYYTRILILPVMKIESLDQEYNDSTGSGTGVHICPGSVHASVSSISSSMKAAYRFLVFRLAVFRAASRSWNRFHKLFQNASGLSSCDIIQAWQMCHFFIGRRCCHFESHLPRTITLQSPNPTATRVSLDREHRYLIKVPVKQTVHVFSQKRT